MAKLCVPNVNTNDNFGYGGIIKKVQKKVGQCSTKYATYEF